MCASPWLGNGRQINIIVSNEMEQIANSLQQQQPFQKRNSLAISR